MSVYEGDNSGAGRQSGEDYWQENRRTQDYVNEVNAVFKNVVYVRGIMYDFGGKR